MIKRSICRNSLALLLSLLLIVGAIPMHAIALDLSESTSSTPSALDEYVVDSQESVSDKLIGEVAEEISLREENVKHFRLSNGTYQAIVYASPVHRRDASGTWQDIDNRLTAVESKGLLQSADSRISLASAFRANEPLLTLRENGYSISMSLLAPPLSGELSMNDTVAPRKEASLTNAPIRPEVFGSIEEAARIDNRSSVLYENVMPSTSIEYILKGNDVKENIIVSAPSNTYAYTFELTLSGLVATLDGKGNIKLSDAESGTTEYVIPAPYMYDAEGAESTAVSYELSAVKEGLYLLRITADAEWINAEGRAFPVTVDPTLVVNNFPSDTYTNSLYPDFNYNCLEELWVSNVETTYIYIPVPSLPSDATMLAAYLNVSYYYHISEGALLAGAYQVSDWWLEDEMTYENAPPISSEQLDAVVLSASSSITESTPGLASFIITEAVNNWYTDDENYGIAIKRESNAQYSNYSVILKAFEAGINEDSYITINYTSTIPSGVYAIQNVQKPTRWMTVENDSTFAGSYMQHTYSTTSPADEAVFDRSSLFKISRVGFTAQYVIRSMLNNNLTFGYSEDGIVTKEIPSDDFDVPIEDTFRIEWEGDGYWIYPYGSTRVISQVNATGTQNINLETVSKDYASNTASWTLVQYTGEHRSGSTVYAPEALTVGTTVTISAIAWATNVGYNEPHLSVATGYTDKASCTWDADTRTGSFVLHHDGELRVIAQIFNGDYALSSSVTHTLYPELVVEEGAYYIENKEFGKCLQINNDDNDNNYNTSGAILELWNLKAKQHEMWELIHIGNGYYKIISEKSGKSISVADGNENKNQKALVQKDYTNKTTQMWKITKTERNSYVFRPKSGEAYETDWCMCAGDPFLDLDSRSNGVNVEQRPYNGTNTSYKDEWLLHEIGSQVMLLSVDATEGNHDHLSCYYDTLRSFTETNYNRFNIVKTGYISKADCIAQMELCKVFISRSHGGSLPGISSWLKLYDTGTASRLYSYDIYDFSTYTAKVDFSDVEIMLYVGCETAYGGNTGRNLITASVNAGANYALGFQNSIPCDAANTWTSYFCEYYAAGQTIYEAAQNAIVSTISKYPDEYNSGTLNIDSLSIAH